MPGVQKPDAARSSRSAQVTEKRRLAAKVPDAAAFAEEEQRLFNTALDQEASANAIQARAEGPPYVVPKSEKSDE